MPIAYLDVPTGADVRRKKTLVKALYEALHEAYPFPDDTRIFLREWPGENLSQNGQLDPEPVRPVFTIHAPEGVNIDAKRTMMQKLNAAVEDAYGLPEFQAFILEHPLHLVANQGNVLADDPQRVEDQRQAYS
jgi:hypothetical protein